MPFTGRHFFRIFAMLLPIVLFASYSSTSFAEDPDSPLQGFPTSEFFGGMSVDLDGLQNHPRYQVLPLDELIPATTSFDYLDTELISQFAIFLKSSDESNCGSHQQFEIAAVGKLRNFDAFDVRKELSRWKNRTTPWRSDACEVEEVKIGNKTCYRFQTGTILNSIRRQGNLEFYNEDGKMKRGVSVGNTTKRGYTTGKKDSKAVVSFAGLRSSDLIEGELVLDLFLDVFNAGKWNKDWCDARVYLQSSDGKLRSSLVEVKARSLVNHTVQFPRELPVFDTESGDAKGTVDLIDDFASDGEFQMVLQSLEKATYIGLKASDIGFLLPRHEYLGINGEFVVVAQSQDSLKQMLELSPQQLAKKIELTEGQQVSASFDLSSKEKLHSFKQFLVSLDMQHAIHALSPSTKSVRLSVEMDRDRIFSAEIGMSELDAATQANQIFESIARKTVPAVNLLRDGRGPAIPLDDKSDKAIGKFADEVYRFVSVRDQLASFRAIMFCSTTFGSRGVTASAVQNYQPVIFPNRSVDRLSMRPLYQKLFDDLASGVQVQGLAGNLAIEFDWPFKDPAELSDTDRLLFAILRLYRANSHHQQMRFVLAEQIERRLVDEFPEEDGLWAALSYRLSYNVQTEFTTKAAKYAWIRRGINVLLDVAESNENSIDPILKAASFIGRKFGGADEGEELRKLFVDDKALLVRIGKHVDLKACLDVKGELDCLSIASQMLERCAQREDRDERVESKMGKLNRTALRIAMLRMRAERFDRRLQFEAANQQWQQILVEWQQMGEQVVELGPSSKLKLSELKTKIDESVVGDDVDVEELEAKAYWYQVWRYTLKFRLSTDGRVIAKHIAKADAFRKEGDYGSASAEAKLALKNIRQTLERAPVRKELVMLLFGDFFYRAEGRYKEMDEEFLKELHGVCEEFGLEAPLFGTLR